jgi:hypothetical protein
MDQQILKPRPDRKSFKESFARIETGRGLQICAFPRRPLTEEDDSHYVVWGTMSMSISDISEISLLY